MFIVITDNKEKELRDFLIFYKREQEYFEECMIKVRKQEEAAKIIALIITFSKLRNFEQSTV